MWWPGTELNRRRQPFQGCALPPELPGHGREPPLRRDEIAPFTLLVAGFLKQIDVPMRAELVDYSNRRAFPQRRPLGSDKV
jgi:hypothetical protein